MFMLIMMPGMTVILEQLLLLLVEILQQVVITQQHLVHGMLQVEVDQ